jgi:hypothetical protein
MKAETVTIFRQYNCAGTLLCGVIKSGWMFTCVYYCPQFYRHIGLQPYLNRMPQGEVPTLYLATNCPSLL